MNFPFRMSNTILDLADITYHVMPTSVFRYKHAWLTNTTKLIVVTLNNESIRKTSSKPFRLKSTSTKKSTQTHSNIIIFIFILYSIHFYKCYELIDLSYKHFHNLLSTIMKSTFYGMV